MLWFLRNPEGCVGARPPRHAEAEEVRRWSRGAAKGTLFSSWKTQAWVLREATSSTSDQNQVFCLKTAPGLGVMLAAGRDRQVSLEGEEYLAQRGISVGQQLLESQPGMGWRDGSHQSLPQTPSSAHSVHMELVILFSRLQHFKECIQFIHECRLGGGGCLVHCLAGVSRSTTILVAYLMTVTELGWQSCLAATKAVRSYASPNAGFQQQLQDYERTLLWEVKSPWIHFGGVCNQVQLLCMQLSVCPSWVLGMSLITWGFGGLHAKKKKENKFLRSASILCERTSKSSGKP
ncbi:dual specificity protein phosphatase-like isoform X1 [Corvus hawaiiensis]|uniref:dual specificity protein phosphatase-like isoform X1 n=1 Tax=Corvus hawaiiensis TaxID=134902 RepID=UPI002019E929|nr:dual specificity protein phosphatase-like isoform X1 [Corvus hawaiiensis]